MLSLCKATLCGVLMICGCDNPTSAPSVSSAAIGSQSGPSDGSAAHAQEPTPKIAEKIREPPPDKVLITGVYRSFSPDHFGTANYATTIYLSSEWKGMTGVATDSDGEIRYPGISTDSEGKFSLLVDKALVLKPNYLHTDTFGLVTIQGRDKFRPLKQNDNSRVILRFSKQTTRIDVGEVSE